MVSLAFEEQTTLVERAAELVDVVLAAEVASELPGRDACAAAGRGDEGIVDDAARFLHLIAAGGPVRVQAVGVNGHGDDVLLAAGQFGKCEGGVVTLGVVEALEGAEELAVEPDGAGGGLAALYPESQLGLGAVGGEVTAVDEGTDMVAIVGGVERDRRQQGYKGVVGIRVRGNSPSRVVVVGLGLWQRVDLLPFQ